MQKTLQLQLRGGDLVWRFGSSPVLFLAARRQGINVVGVGEAVGLIACESDQKQKVGMTGIF